jgi:hypothetical protein
MPYQNTDNSKPYHWGRKQVYYLNTVQTRSHTAYFLKSLRDDALGAKVYSIYKNNQTNNKILGNYSEEDEVWLRKEYNNIWPVPCLGNQITADWYWDYLSLPDYHLSLKLDKIVIVDNSVPKYAPGNGVLKLLPSNFDVNGVIGGRIVTKKYHKFCQVCTNDVPSDDQFNIPLINSSFKTYYQNNIFNIYDLPDAVQNNQATKIIKFNYD